MATKHINTDDSEALLRDYVMVLLRQGFSMHHVITSLQAIKVEMVAATQYQDAINEALYHP
jgi:hypothetical protein